MASAVCAYTLLLTASGNWEPGGAGFVREAVRCGRRHSASLDAHRGPRCPSFVPLSLPFSGVCGTVLGTVWGREEFTPWFLPQEAVPSM